jgi:hypothetical protein
VEPPNLVAGGFLFLAFDGEHSPPPSLDV